KQRIVHLKHRDLAYDFLILATGIRYNYFGHDEWRPFAPGLESLDDADVIRSKILVAFERAEEMASIEQAGTEEIRRLLTFALVGAGTVEFGWNSRQRTESSGRHCTLGSWSRYVSGGAVVRCGNRQVRKDHGGTGFVRT